MPAMLRKKDDPIEVEVDRRSTRRSWSREPSPSVRSVPIHMRIPAEFTSCDDKQYGVESRKSYIYAYCKGYPEPKVTWFAHGHKLEMEGRFSTTITREGELALEIQEFCWQDVGIYKVCIQNEFGKQEREINVDMADPPTFCEPMKNQVFHLRQGGKLECRVQGIPYPKVSFKHDWRMLADSHRVKVLREDQDHWTVNFANAIRLDEGLYECVAENVAGKVYCTATVKVTEKPGLYRDIRFNQVPVEDYFHVIDEIGRGSYGVVRRVIDKNTGNQYAAKILRFSDPVQKEKLMAELEMMALLDQTNIVQIVDGYEDKKRLILVMEIVTGGDLFSRIIKEDSWRESEAAYYLRQLLLAVEFMHCKSVVHLDLKPENLFMLSQSSDELKLIDFGFARRYNPSRKLHSSFGTPEFCSPEVANSEPVTLAADMWSVGVIAYIMLSGKSPFHRPTPRETLEAVRKGEWSFDKEAFANISKEAKDFITACLNRDPKKRITATDAINSKFMELVNHRGLGDRISLDNLKGYTFRRKWEKTNSMVKNVVSLKTLSDFENEEHAGEHEIEVEVPVLSLPTMPGEEEAPREEAGAAGMLQMLGPDSLMSGAASTIGSGGSSEWGREYEDEDTWYEFTSAYQSGADTYLLPSQDTGLSLRMAKYRRSASEGGGRPPRASLRMSMKERRDLRDVEREREEEAGEEEVIKSRKHKSRRGHGVWQLKEQAESSRDGFPPVFKEKIHDKAYNVGESCTMSVRLMANPPPAVSWYRNDEHLTDGGRVRTTKSEDGRYSLTILSTKPHDFGVFKCVARNKFGTVTCRARMSCGNNPDRPGRPHVTQVSDTEAFMIWEEPESDGNSYILAYRVDWHKPGDERWTTATYCIDECALVKGLKPNNSYRFRVSAINKFGISPYSWGSVEIRTLKAGGAPITMDHETRAVLTRSRQATSRPSPEPSPVSSPYGSMEDLTAIAEAKKDFGVLDREIHLQEGVDPEKYITFGSEVWRGRFTIVRNVKPKEGKKVKRVAKIIPFNPANADESLREYEMLKSVRQEHIVRLHEAFLYNDCVVLVLEKMYGENVCRSLSLKNKYNEHQVSTIIKQVLDGLQFLHHRGIVHLNVQPDNVVMISRRRFDIKLIDFGRARKVTTYEGEKLTGVRDGTAEFMAPEKVNKELVGVPADIWGVGVLAFILMSGQSPFRGVEDVDTYANISTVRYDAHALFHNCTKYGLKFIYQILKRNPTARLTTEEALEHKWLMLNAPLIKGRKAAIFPAERLKVFEEQYIARRRLGSQISDHLMATYGQGTAVSSDEEDDIFASQPKW